MSELAQIPQNPTPYTPAIWEKAFLSKLSKQGNVSDACKSAKVDRSTVYYRKDNHPQFAALWAEALELASDELEREAWRRAVTGVEKPVYQQKEKVGTITEYSDNLLTLLLKAHRPEKFAERKDITSGGKPIKGYIGISPDDWDEGEGKT